MERTRVKTVLLTLLVCINLLLGVNLLSAQYRRHHIPRRAGDEITAFLAHRGMRLADRALPAYNKSLPQITYKSDERQSQALVSALLGEAVRTDEGGGRIVYESPRGHATFRRGGQMEITLPADAAPPADAAQTAKAARALLRQAKLPVPRGSLVFGRHGDEVFVRFSQKKHRLDVENAALEVRFAPGVTVISGRLMFGRTVETPVVLRGIVSLLADFASVSAQYQLEVDQITRVSYAYYHTSDEEGRPLLLPACRIETSRRTFLLNAADGTLFP